MHTQCRPVVKFVFTAAMDVLKGIELNEARFLTLLEKLIGNAEKVQNMPPEHVPHEAIMVDFVMEVLAPVTVCDKLAVSKQHL